MCDGAQCVGVPTSWPLPQADVLRVWPEVNISDWTPVFRKLDSSPPLLDDKPVCPGNSVNSFIWSRSWCAFQFLPTERKLQDRSYKKYMFRWLSERLVTEPEHKCCIISVGLRRHAVCCLNKAGKGLPLFPTLSHWAHTHAKVMLFVPCYQHLEEMSPADFMIPSLGRVAFPPPQVYESNHKQLFQKHINISLHTVELSHSVQINTVRCFICRPRPLKRIKKQQLPVNVKNVLRSRHVVHGSTYK